MGIFHYDLRWNMLDDCFYSLLPSEDVRHLLTQNGDYCVRTTEIKAGDDRQVSFCQQGSEFYLF